jgi:spore germination protein YaaH
VWFSLEPDGVSVRALAGADDPGVLAAARAHGVQVIPLVASVDGPDRTRLMLGDPARRDQHVAALVALANRGGYQGLDLDYEQLWTAADRAPFTAFAGAFASAMHAAGKQASMAIPAIDGDGPDSAWSYNDLAAALDQLHIMGYDFHTPSTHAGPTAPLGWIEAVADHAAATGRAERFLLGLPNYGVAPGFFAPLGICAAACDGPVAETTDHMASCPFGSYAAGRAPNCASSHGALFFDDSASLVEKATAARARGLGGITYWNVGNEPPGFFDDLRAVYP